ncbi:hypothetical protein [Inquilinus sp. CAU 1745]|uniref:hypothetical protein n=1 Tax=Inquilinus sp. CAU 1745 TaxID=3140369 RepID=UPI00325B6131
MNQISNPHDILPCPASSTLLSAAPTLADVIAAVLASEMKSETATRIAGDIRIVANWLDRDPADIAAHPGVLRQKLTSIHHEHVGLSAKRLANIRSNMRRGLEMIGHVDNRPSSKPIDRLDGPWRDLWDRIAGTWRAPQLSQLIRYCTVHGVAPEEVSDQTFDAWGAWRAAGTGSIASDPLVAVARARRAWNNCVAHVPDWPRQPVTVESRRVRVTRDLDEFPEGFREDLALFRAKRGLKSAGATKWRFHEAAGTEEEHVLSASKTEHCIAALRLAATAAVEEGMVPLDEITDIGSILSVEVADATIQHIIDRNGLSEYVLTVAKNLSSVARRWLDLSSEDHAEWRAFTSAVLKMLKRKINFDKFAMTRTNRRRLAQFTDPQAVSRLFSYPWSVLDELEIERKLRRTVTHEMALKAMSAVAVAILTTLPLRRGTLHLLRWDEHVTLPLRRGQGRLAVSGHEVKNRRDLSAPLAPEMVDILRLYRRHYQPALTDGSDNQHVFPAGNGAGPRGPGQLATNVVTRVNARTGLIVNLHLFRHLMATLALAKASETVDIAKAASLVEGLLGASPGSKIINRYAELTTSMAAAWTDENIARPHRPKKTLHRREWRR